MFKKIITKPHITDTLIGSGTVVEGKLVSEASLRIDGQFSGEIECEGNVIIGESGIVLSTILAKNIINAGTIEGTIVAREALTIAPTGKVSGSIDAKTLIILEGGVLQGISKMNPKTSHERTAPTAPHSIESKATPSNHPRVKKEAEKSSAAG